MDALVRRRRRVLIGVSVAALVASLPFLGCAVGGAGAGVVGVSDKPQKASAAPAGIDAGPRDGAAALPPGYRESFTKLTLARVPSQGHATGRWELDVFANDAGAHAMATRAREVPVGASVVAEHYERGGARGAGPVMVMEKRERGYAPDHGDWRYVVVGSAGQLVNDGVIASCAGCHDDAPMDGLFPIVP